jgi:ABC-type amino acid transport system permease subunit
MVFVTAAPFPVSFHLYARSSIRSPGSPISLSTSEEFPYSSAMDRGGGDTLLVFFGAVLIGELIAACAAVIKVSYRGWQSRHCRRYVIAIIGVAVIDVISGCMTFVK